MEIKKNYNGNHGKWFVSDVLNAALKYTMMEKGERVCVALSGGKDSITLLYILYYINRYTYLKLDLTALHIKTADYETDILRSLCGELEIPYLEGGIRYGEKDAGDKRCYLCTRLKRGAISEILKENGIRKVAYGHHADDVAETFLMNIIHNRKLGSFSPKVGYRDNPMEIIRPMIYLTEKTIIRIHQYTGLPLLNYKCPHEEHNVRKEIKAAAGRLDGLFNTEGFNRKVVDALENIDTTNIWSDLL